MQNDTSQESTFDMKYYIKLIFRWVWLIAICTIITAGVTYFVSQQITPVYQATTTVMVNFPASPKSTDYNAIVMNERLAITYSQMMTSREVLEKVASQLGLTNSPASLQKLISVTPIKDTQLVSVIAENTDPEMAAGIANKIVDVFSKQVIAGESSHSSTLAQDLQNQIQSIEEKISTLHSELQKASTKSNDENIAQLDQIIKDLQTQINQTQNELVQLVYDFPSMKAYDVSGRSIIVTATPNVDERKQIAMKEEQLNYLRSLLEKYQSQYVTISSGGQATGQVNAEIERIQSSITLYQGVYTTLMQNYENIRQTDAGYSGSVTQVDRASVPLHPARPNISLFVLVGALMGFAASTGGIIVFDAMDDRIKDPNIISERFKLPILATIYAIPGKSKIISVEGALQTPTAEAFRMLRTNLLHSRDNNPPQVILVTSPGPNDGKTTIATNLATVFAQSGLRVTLIDGDLRKPQLHQLVGTLNDLGLSDLILHPDQDTIDRATLAMNGFSMISSGPIPDNPSELLDSGQMRIILEKLLKRTDFIIIDSPPVLSVPDALILSTYVDGVVLVVKPDSINAHLLDQTIQQLKRVDATLLGAVINGVRIIPGSSSYHNYYSHKNNKMLKLRTDGKKKGFVYTIFPFLTHDQS